MKKASLALTALAAIALTTTACSVSTTPGGDTGSGSEDTLSIGFSQATQQSPFYVELGEGVKVAAEAAGAELEYVDANGDVTKQNNDIEDLITKGVDVLLINPVDPQGIARASPPPRPPASRSSPSTAPRTARSPTSVATTSRWDSSSARQ